MRHVITKWFHIKEKSWAFASAVGHFVICDNTLFKLGLVLWFQNFREHENSPRDLFKIQIPQSHLPFCLGGLYLATSQGGSDVGRPKDTFAGMLAYVHKENRYFLPTWLETLRTPTRNSKSQHLVHSLLKSGFGTFSGFAYITYFGWWPTFLTTSLPWSVGFLFSLNYGARDRSGSLPKVLPTFYSDQKHYLCLKVTDLNVSLMTQNGARSRYLLPKFYTCFSSFLVKYLLSVWIGKGYFTPKANGDGFGWCLFILFEVSFSWETHSG